MIIKIEDQDILEDAGDESVISYIKLEQAAGRVPNSKRVIDIVVNGRRETLRRLLQIDTEANKIGDSQYLFDLVREMIRTGDGATPENGPTFKIIDDSQKEFSFEPIKYSDKKIPEKIEPSANNAKGIVITDGDSFKLFNKSFEILLFP